MAWRFVDTQRDVLESPCYPYGQRFNAFSARTYERKDLPSPGAQNYAYENLGLVEYSPIGGGINIRQPIVPFRPTLFVVQGAYVQGLGGLATGGVIGQPLMTPSSPMPSQNPVL